MTQSNWISVTESFPPNQERVLCYSPTNDVFLGWYGYFYILGPRWVDDSQCGNCDEKHYLTDITHWQPLPEEPKV